MQNLDFLRNELYNRYGTVQRSRGCFLYTKKGVRLTDLYQENGRAITGWDAGSAFTMFKNTMNKGILGSFITEQSDRTEKAVSQLLNSSREVFFFSDYMTCVKAAASVAPDSTMYFRPWNPEEIHWEEKSCVIIAPNFPWTQNLFILAVKEGLEAQNKIVSEKIPACLNAGIARAIYDLIKALQERSEKDWFRYDKILTKYWERKGPYLFPKIAEERYKDFVLHCLDCGIVINPDYNSPSIVPFGADIGVFTKLKNNPFEL